MMESFVHYRFWRAAKSPRSAVQPTDRGKQAGKGSNHSCQTKNTAPLLDKGLVATTSVPERAELLGKGNIAVGIAVASAAEMGQPWCGLALCGGDGGESNSCPAVRGCSGSFRTPAKERVRKLCWLLSPTGYKTAKSIAFRPPCSGSMTKVANTGSWEKATPVGCCCQTGQKKAPGLMEPGAGGAGGSRTVEHLFAAVYVC